MPDHVTMPNDMDAVRDLVARASADIESAGLSVAVGVFDLARSAWAAGEGEAPAADFGTSGYVLVIGRNQHALDAPAAEFIDGAEIIDEVQDWVMGELGRAWPEAPAGDGRSSKVLSVAREGDEIVWTDGSLWVIPVGNLARIT